MRFLKTDIPGVWLIEPDFHKDERGHFFRAWCVKEFEEHGIQFHAVQANLGFSLRKATVRGMHFQVEPAPEAKLIRCTRGAMFDVALDVHRDSATYGKWAGVELTPENGKMLFIPERCAHGYQTLQDNTEMHYMTSQFYSPAEARGARFDDPAFGIRWPLVPSVISEQDRNWSLSVGQSKC